MLNELKNYLNKLDEQIKQIQGVDKDAYIGDELAAFDAKQFEEKERFEMQQAEAREQFKAELLEACEKDQTEAVEELLAEKKGLEITVRKLEQAEAPEAEMPSEDVAQVEEVVEGPAEDPFAQPAVEEDVAVEEPAIVEEKPVETPAFPNMN